MRRVFLQARKVHCALKPINILVLLVVGISVGCSPSSPTSIKTALPNAGATIATAASSSLPLSTFTTPPVVQTKLPITPTSATTNLVIAQSTLAVALPNSWQSRWLNAIPCQPPCFEGITPGQTTVTEAEEILKKNPLIKDVKIDGFSDLGLLRWNWINSSWSGRAKYYTTSTQIVYYISPNFQISFRLGEVIQGYGQPSHIVATASYLQHGEGISYSLALVFIPQGFVFTVSDHSKPVLNNNLLSMGINFFAPTIEGYVKGTGENLKSLTAWQGFHSFEFYCQDNDEFSKGACKK